MATSKDLKRFCQTAHELGAIDAVVVSPPKEVFTAAWVRQRCQFGCSEYGRCLTCPPHAPTPEATRKTLDEYRSAILIHGDRWKKVREIAQALERTVFLAGYYKAFAYLCGPCDHCPKCPVVGWKGGTLPVCRHAELARPAMEGAGIDVFATARAAGLPIEVVTERESPQNYYALVLVE
jgi:predicted metal-binding protein